LGGRAAALFPSPCREKKKRENTPPWVSGLAKLRRAALKPREGKNPEKGGLFRRGIPAKKT